MRTSLVLSAACALMSCQKAAPSPARETDVHRMVREYEAWAAQQPRPGEQMVDRVETLLAQESCIGRLDRWSRTYGFAMLPERTIDTGIVKFHLEEAGAHDVVPGRRITEPDSWINLDDRRIRIAFGDYDLREDRVRIAFCGNNVGPPSQGDIDNYEPYRVDLARRRAANRR